MSFSNTLAAVALAEEEFWRRLRKAKWTEGGFDGRVEPSSRYKSTPWRALDLPLLINRVWNSDGRKMFLSR
jgi:hypothetical protein